MILSLVHADPAPFPRHLVPSGTRQVILRGGLRRLSNGHCGRNAELVKALGGEVIDYTTRDITRGGEARCDLILDAVGSGSGGAFKRSWPMAFLGIGWVVDNGT